MSDRWLVHACAVHQPTVVPSTQRAVVPNTLTTVV